MQRRNAYLIDADAEVQRDSNIYCLLMYSFRWATARYACLLLLCSRLDLCCLLHEQLSLNEFESLINETTIC